MHAHILRAYRTHPAEQVAALAALASSYNPLENREFAAQSAKPELFLDRLFVLTSKAAQAELSEVRCLCCYTCIYMCVCV